MIELLVTVSIVALLVSFSVPSFRTAINNRQTHAVAETIENALRLAQSTATQQSRSTTLCLTNSTPSASLVAAAPNSNCVANGKYWFIQTNTLFTDENPAYLRGGTFGDIGPNVAITGPATLDFSALGRTSVATRQVYKFTNPYADFKSTATRYLGVTVEPGGQIRMCDSSRSMSNSADGCP